MKKLLSPQVSLFSSVISYVTKEDTAKGTWGEEPRAKENEGLKSSTQGAEPGHNQKTSQSQNQWFSPSLPSGIS